MAYELMTNIIRPSNQVVAKNTLVHSVTEPGYFPFLETVLLPALTRKQACGVKARWITISLEAVREFDSVTLLRGQIVRYVH